MKAHDSIAEAVRPESKIRTSGIHCIQNGRRLHFSGGKNVKYNKLMVQTKTEFWIDS